MSASRGDAYDLAVIGGGPGGYTAAIRAARLGLRPVLVEAEARLGGICLNWGCIPTKALLRQAEVLKLTRRAGDFGLSLPGAVGWDWDAVTERSRGIAAELAKGVDHLMRQNGIDVVHGRGRLTPARAIDVTPSEGGAPRVLAARHILLATGGRPRSLPGIDIDGERVISSRQAMALSACPKSLVIIGAGAIGVEFATFFRAFGTQVTLLESEGRVLPREDPEASQLLAASLAAEGVAVHTGARVAAVEGAPRRRTVSVTFEVAGEAAEVRAERVLLAVGVQGNTENLGLETLGIRVEGGTVPVDEAYATRTAGVYAIGDLIGPPQLAHVATAEAIAAVDGIAGRASRRVDPERIPSCTYSQPQVASIGLTEAEARAQGIEVRVGRFPFAASGRARAAGEAEGFVKLVFGARYGDLLGGVIVGPEATELIGELGLALSLEATWEELAQTVHAHPTLAEGIMEAAAAAFGEAIHI